MKFKRNYKIYKIAVFSPAILKKKNHNYFSRFPV